MFEYFIELSQWYCLMTFKNPSLIELFFFRATTADVDYLENQCAENPIGQATCDYQEYENQDIGFPDLQITVANQAEVTKKQFENSYYMNNWNIILSSSENNSL